jgi:molybdenum cofactor cytidylyltransferase
MKLNTDNIDLSLIILAGGRSSRMGHPKPWIKKESGITFLNDIITSYRQFGIDNIIVVLNEEFTQNEWEEDLLAIKKKAIIIKNNQVDKGRLHSLQLGLYHSSSAYNIIHNVDNPFVEYKVLNQLTTNINKNTEIIIPTFNSKGGHPVIVNERVKNEIVNHHQKYNTLKDIFSMFHKNYVAVESISILTNINTPQDLESLIYESV